MKGLFEFRILSVHYISHRKRLHKDRRSKQLETESKQEEKDISCSLNDLLITQAKGDQ